MVLRGSYTILAIVVNADLVAEKFPSRKRGREGESLLDSTVSTRGISPQNVIL